MMIVRQHDKSSHTELEQTLMTFRSGGEFGVRREYGSGHPPSCETFFADDMGPVQLRGIFYTHARARTHAHTHTHTNKHTHKHTQTHKHTHTHTTHTHTHQPSHALFPLHPSSQVGLPHRRARPANAGRAARQKFPCLSRSPTGSSSRMHPPDICTY